MDKNYCVYKHTSPSGKVYIGITRRSPRTRWGSDGTRYKNNHHFYNAICKYGWDSFTHEVLISGLDGDTAGELEKKLIRFYNSANPEHGYNNTWGGEHGKMADHVNEENRRRGKMLIGTKNPFYGKTHTEASKKLMRNARLNNPDRFKQSSVGGQAAKIAIGKEVSQYTKSGEYIATYQCLADAAASLGKRNGANHIGAVCAGNRKSAYGYLWSFEKAPKIQPVTYDIKYGAECYNARQIIQCDKSGTALNVFQTVSDAAIAVAGTIVAASNISACAKNNKKTAYGFVWKYVDKTTEVS